jgi:hypothetical protein
MATKVGQFTLWSTLALIALVIIALILASQ